MVVDQVEITITVAGERFTYVVGCWFAASPGADSDWWGVLGRTERSNGDLRLISRFRWSGRREWTIAHAPGGTAEDDAIARVDDAVASLAETGFVLVDGGRCIVRGNNAALGAFLRLWPGGAN